MKSTGEVMGIDSGFPVAFAKAQLGAGMVLPQAGTVFVSVKDSDKPVILPAAQKLDALGFRIVATGGTATFLTAAGVKVERVNKVAEGRPHIVDRIIDGEIALIFNTTEGWQSHKDLAIDPRLGALWQGALIFTTAAASVAAAGAIEALRSAELAVGLCRIIINRPRDPLHCGDWARSGSGADRDGMAFPWRCLAKGLKE
jgi:carbamoyl-phosphate synthase large subunit